jgi:mono/diheme cytochrome c family protein
MTSRHAVYLLAIVLGTAVAARAQTMALPLDGAKLYTQYCASCHGAKADGFGPMAGALKAKVPDLSLIAARNGGAFPMNRVQAVIAGEQPAGLSHGTREMPVWGPIFSQDISDRDYGKLRIYNVAKFLEGLQKK